MEKEKYCPNCYEPISKEQRDDVDYDYECINCDENFYGFELYVEKDTIEITKIK